MKKNYLMIVTVVLLALMLAACGSSSDTSSQEGSQDSSQEQTQEAEEQEAEEAVHPYAWLGLQDMPKCDYLDILATKHFYQKSKTYIEGMSYVSKETKAEDGINTYKKDSDRIVYSIDGKVTSINKSNKTYMEQDASDLAESAKEELAAAMEKGENRYGRSFKETGSGTIPVYGEEKKDKTEYEYYEYEYPDYGSSDEEYFIERYYMKDGDVFAIYTESTAGDSVIKSTEVIKSMSGDIPEGLFDLPDLSDYEKLDI